jgi:hypothetical protein
MALAPHQARVLNEKLDLDEKLNKLADFLQTPMFASLDVAERNRLILQRHAMELYSGILSQRVAAF